MNAEPQATTSRRIYRFGEFELDPRQMEVRHRGLPSDIHATPLRVLLCLVRNNERTVPKAELFEAVWPGLVVSEAALATALKEARRVLGDDGKTQRWIQTRRGFGYKFVAPVREVVPPLSTGALADQETHSIAVLPIDGLGDPEHERLADGVTDALIESLARVGPELRVISRTSVLRYKGTIRPAREIAAELGVSLLIEGTAQRQDDRVLIRVQLIDAREDAHLWVQSYERDIRDFFSVQREIARTVAAEVNVALKPDREPLLAAARPVDPEALDLYLRAVSLMAQPGPWAQTAMELLERSVALDPDFAEGWLELARAHTGLGVGFGVGSQDNFVRAREAAQRALELDERLGAAHAALGTVRLLDDWDFSGARTSLERAVELSPSDPRALNGLALYFRLVGLGTSPEAELLLERLLRVAPLDILFRAQRITHYLYAREYECGIAEAERVRELNPEYAHVNIAQLYILLGQPEDFVRELLAAFARAGNTRAVEACQRASEEGGWQGAVRATRRPMIKLATQGAFGLAYGIAALSAILGETEVAMSWLERTYEKHEPMLLFAKIDPHLDPLRSDPRFDDLLRRIGFPES